MSSPKKSPWRDVGVGEEGVVQQRLFDGDIIYRVLWADGRTTTFPWARNKPGMKRAFDILWEKQGGD